MKYDQKKLAGIIWYFRRAGRLSRERVEEETGINTSRLLRLEEKGYVMKVPELFALHDYFRSQFKKIDTLEEFLQFDVPEEAKRS